MENFFSPFGRNFLILFNISSTPSPVSAEIGYGLDLSKCAVTSEKDNLVFVSPSTGSAVTEIGAGDYKSKLLKLPSFLIDHKIMYSKEDVLDGLNLSEFFLKKWFFLPNNLHFPESRNRLKDMFII